MLIGITGGPTGISAGEVLDSRLPHLSPAPPGRYRACFYYRVPNGRQKEQEQELCSEEFSLP
jgi:hypothetical protein